jgi:hypothetical protein
MQFRINLSSGPKNSRLNQHGKTTRFHRMHFSKDAEPVRNSRVQSSLVIGQNRRPRRPQAPPVFNTCKFLALNTWGARNNLPPMQFRDGFNTIYDFKRCLVDQDPP